MLPNHNKLCHLVKVHQHRCASDPSPWQWLALHGILICPAPPEHRHGLRLKELLDPPTETGAHQPTQTSTPRSWRQTGSLGNNTRGSAAFWFRLGWATASTLWLFGCHLSPQRSPQDFPPGWVFWSWDINSFPSTLSYSIFLFASCSSPSVSLYTLWGLSLTLRVSSLSFCYTS